MRDLDLDCCCCCFTSTYELAGLVKLITTCRDFYRDWCDLINVFKIKLKWSNKFKERKKEKKRLCHKRDYGQMHVRRTRKRETLDLLNLDWVRSTCGTYFLWLLMKKSNSFPILQHRALRKCPWEQFVLIIWLSGMKEERLLVCDGDRTIENFEWI